MSWSRFFCDKKKQRNCTRGSVLNVPLILKTLTFKSGTGSLKSYQFFSFLCFFWHILVSFSLSRADFCLINDPKTLPMGTLHEYMSCWTTLGPFRYPRGPQNGPKQHQNGLEWLNITRMAQNGTAWPKMTLNTSHEYITWLYVMLDHSGPFSEAHGGPKMAQNSTKNGPSWPQMALHDPNGPKTLLMGILHDIMSCWTTLGPF